MVPILPEYQAFLKCDETCLGCKGPAAGECTACYAGKRLNVKLEYKADTDPYPYGTCESICETSKYSATTPDPNAVLDKDKFWGINSGWICKNCHHTCYDCSAGTDANCYVCRYSDSVLKNNVSGAPSQ